jgi:hypothetical protein
MLNSHIINSICSYLNNKNIIKLHKITKFYPNIHLWNYRLLDKKQFTRYEFDYLLSNFPVKNLFLEFDTDKDIHILENYINIRKLMIYYYNAMSSCANVDISFISVCKNLKELWLYGFPCLTFNNNTKYIRQCNNLKGLHIKCIRGVNIEILSKFKNIEELSLCETRLKNINFITPLHKNLRVLDISCNVSLSDLSPIINCPKLECFSMNVTSISDISPISNCLELKEFIHDGINKINPIHLLKCRKLQIFYSTSYKEGNNEFLDKCLYRGDIYYPNSQNDKIRYIRPKSQRNYKIFHPFSTRFDHFPNV